MDPVWQNFLDPHMKNVLKKIGETKQGSNSLTKTC